MKEWREVLSACAITSNSSSTSFSNIHSSYLIPVLQLGESHDRQRSQLRKDRRTYLNMRSGLPPLPPSSCCSNLQSQVLQATCSSSTHPCATLMIMTDSHYDAPPLPCFIFSAELVYAVPHIAIPKNLMTGKGQT